MVEYVGGPVERGGAEAEGLVHVEDPVEEDGPHLAVEVPLGVDEEPGGVLRLWCFGGVVVGCWCGVSTKAAAARMWLIHPAIHSLIHTYKATNERRTKEGRKTASLLTHLFIQSHK